MAGVSQDPVEQQGDLAVGSGDGDAHHPILHPTGRAPATAGGRWTHRCPDLGGPGQRHEGIRWGPEVRTSVGAGSRSPPRPSGEA